MESTTFLLKDKDGNEEAIFTGDTLFLGDVGRPDLAQKAADMSREQLAEILYDSLRNKIMTLPKHLTVYPGHGAGSACGKNMMKETVENDALRRAELERKEKQRLALLAERELNRQKRLIEEKKEAKRLKALEGRLLPIRQAIWSGLDSKYLQTLGSLQQLDPDNICDLEKEILTWLKQYFQNRGNDKLSDEQLNKKVTR